eukprot:TRINITY_DN62317_c0_g1_i1.p1 TRINITY_DN62317_c0_g1~~TRINITY_DN62317_c0_g1_i1.p1  ORF type:complete len:127 (-),score=13.10 TRINITY_DN62317_c0_g1_i1:197-577(-)
MTVPFEKQAAPDARCVSQGAPGWCPAPCNDSTTLAQSSALTTGGPNHDSLGACSEPQPPSERFPVKILLLLDLLIQNSTQCSLDLTRHTRLPYLLKTIWHTLHLLRPCDMLKPADHASHFKCCAVY